jgi:hypothetical protein
MYRFSSVGIVGIPSRHPDPTTAGMDIALTLGCPTKQETATQKEGPASRAFF